VANASKACKYTPLKTPAFAPLATAIALALSAAPAKAADTILHNFTGGTTDGSQPYGSLTLAGSMLYGLTTYGGSNGSGTIFRLNTNGSGYTSLHNFAAGGPDGFNPYGSLTISGSSLYGMTSGGGGNNQGSLFTINTDGTGYSLLHSFQGNADGTNPYGSLTLSGSTLYGMTYINGSGFDGTIFSMNTNGSGYTVLHSFTGPAADGSAPRGSLTLLGSKLYGMTSLGGSTNDGALFSINTDGSGYSLLHSFGSVGDGDTPYYGSLTAFGSKLYGMTPFGGSSGSGTIFSINADGSGYTLLHSFDQASSHEGFWPYGSLTLIGSKLYGMASGGGIGLNSDGTIFSINTDGSGFRVLQNFSGQPGDGDTPYGDLALSGDGRTFYGMTNRGGTTNNGVIFSMPTGVPEPATAALLLGGVALLALRRQRA
jgi:uncharacterized repeat protein (TIGR03803 family)